MHLKPAISPARASEQAGQRTSATTLYSRRSILVCGATGLLACVHRDLAREHAHKQATWAEDALSRLESQTGGRLGVSVLDTETGMRFARRGGERFAMCSTFKALLAGLTLVRVDAGDEQLDAIVPIKRDDLLFWSPVTEKLVERGEKTTVQALCSATVRTSDNAAANLLLKRLGGPSGFTAGVRGWGDEVTRLDRYELELNENAPNDPRDTSTPDAMVDTLHKVLFGEGLTKASQQLLRGWMIGAKTGLKRIRAGLPGDWNAGDKTGTSSNNQSNDVAFAIPPGRKPLLIVSYLNVPEPMSKAMNAIHAEIGRISATFAGTVRT